MCYNFDMRCLVVAVILVSAVIQGEQSGGEPNKQQGDSHEPVANSPSQTFVWIEEQKPEKPAQNSNGSKNESDSYFHVLFSAQNLPQLILALVGIIGIAVAVCTLKKIDKQAVETARAAKATEDSAKAAADNIILTHRPKLVIRGIGLVPGKYVEGESGTTIQDDVQWQVKYIVANVGGTEAHVTDSNLTITHINVVDGELFPEFPPYSESRHSMGVFTIKPGEHQERMVVLDQEPDTMRLRILKQMVRKGSLHTSGTAYLLGFIQYRDNAGVSRRTAFFRHYDAQTERFRRDKYPETPDSYEYAD